MDDVVINKLATIERCLVRIKDVYQQAGDQFLSDYTRQDSIILNLQRACEAAIDLANYINKLKSLGIPQSSQDSFELLQRAGLLPLGISDNLKKMVGLRDIAVHDYQELNLDIVKFVVENHLVDFQNFGKVIKSLLA